MCGLWASIGAKTDTRVIDVIAHRGPDGEGWREFETPAGTVTFGHRRLAIIDLSHGADQPLSYGDGRYWIVYNGELYNYVELREELVALGHRFVTQSDTEVILAAWSAWGKLALPRFIGMFAFTIYDAKEQEVIVARDPFGIKPLYYYQSPEGIEFASEIKQFYATGRRVAMHEARVLDFIISALTDHDRETTFAGVRQLRGGEWLRLKLSDFHPATTVTPEVYYSLPLPGTLDMSASEAAATFHDLLKESVRIHLRSDVTVGSCLSGGLDSSALVCLMAELQGGGQGIHTVSACYDDANVDEREYITEVLQQTGARSSYVFPQHEDLPRDIDKLTWHQDLPLGSTSIFAQWNVFREAHTQQLKVMLDGQGADEQLAGYHGGFSTYLTELAAQGRWLDVAQTVIGRRIHQNVPMTPQLKQYLFHALRHRPSVGGVATASASPPLAVPSFLNRDFWAQHVHTADTTVEAMRRDMVFPADTVGRLCRAMVRTISMPNLLRFEDRNSMAFGIEARVPFLDPRLVNFTLALGSNHKFKHHTTKWMLREGMKEILPAKITHRHSKLGFPTPEERWFRGPLKSFLRDELDQALSRYAPLFDVKEVKAMADRMLDKGEAYNGVLWRIAHLGIWGRVFDNAALNAPANSAINAA